MCFGKKLCNCRLTLIIILMFSSDILATPCDSNNPDFHIYGLCFGPYRGEQEPGDEIDPNQIQEMLDTISPHIEWVRSYGATHGLEVIPFMARQLGLKVAMGTWIRDSDKEAELNSLSQNADSNYVDIAVIGNEEVYAYKKNHDNHLDPNDFILVIKEAKSKLSAVDCNDIPIAIAEPFDSLFSMDDQGRWKANYPELIKAVNILFVNIFPFHEGTHIDSAILNIAQRYQCAVDIVHSLDPNVQVMIGETGWPSDGLTKGDAEPSLDNEANYFYKVTTWAEINNISMFYFSAFDENYKEDPNHLYTLIDRHWGIWDSNGRIKDSFINGPVLCENFDSPTNSFCVRRDWWASTAPNPDIWPSEPNSGPFLRLLYDNTGKTWYSSIAFDRIVVGVFPRITADFDFRLSNNDADGFSFMLIPTILYGARGCTTYHPGGFVAEEPNLPKTFAVGFDVSDEDGPDDKISISWDERWFPEDNARFTAPFNLNDGKWHHAAIDLRAFDNGKALVTISLIHDIYQSGPHESNLVVDNLILDDPNRLYEPYENRVEFTGRNGFFDTDADIDNIHVSYGPQVCSDILAGDLNNDCIVNLSDFMIFAQNWMLNCIVPSYSPARTSK